MRQVGLILEDGFQLMGLAALAAFELANAELGDDGYLLTLLSEHGGTVHSSMNAGIETVPVDIVPDTLMVAGELVPKSVSAGLCAYVARAGSEARRVAGVCTGAFVLAQAGLWMGARQRPIGRMRAICSCAFRRCGWMTTVSSSVTAISGPRRACPRRST